MNTNRMSQRTRWLLTGAGAIGLALGLVGILLCSMLGGMRAVTWTQVAQYIVLIIAYMIPVVWLSVKQTGVPIPQLVYGQQLQKVSTSSPALLQLQWALASRLTALRLANLVNLKALPKGVLFYFSLLNFKTG